MIRSLTVALTIVLSATGALAQQASEWSRFRGPNGSGIAEGQKPPVEFGPGKNLRWKVSVPSGMSSPIVAGDNLVLTAFESGKLYTIAYSRKSGKLAWKADARAGAIERYQRDAGSPAAGTPATDGKRIVVYFGSCGLICYSLVGKELWRHKLPPAEIYGDYGSGVSPIIADGMVVLVRDIITGSSIFALDLATGKPRWKTSRLSKVSWCSPIVWDQPSGKQVVSAGHGAMVGYDLKTGTERWSVRSMPSGCCSSPVVADGTLYFSGWTSGASGDKSSQMPSFDSMLKDLDKNKDGKLSRAEAGKAMGSFFDNEDLNRDGFLTRDEYDDLVKLLAEGKNSVFALKPGGLGDITESHMIWKKTRGMGYIPSVLCYQGLVVMVKDGGIVTALDAKTGNEAFVERLGAPGDYQASPVAANGYIYFASQNGVVTVMKPADGKPVIKVMPRLDQQIVATPIIADNTLYVRTNKSLFAFAGR